MTRTNPCISNANRRTDGQTEKTDGQTEWGIAIALSQIGWLGLIKSLLDYKIVGLFSKYLTNWNLGDFSRKKSDFGTSHIEKD